MTFQAENSPHLAGRPVVRSATGAHMVWGAQNSAVTCRQNDPTPPGGKPLASTLATAPVGARRRMSRQHARADMAATRTA